MIIFPNCKINLGLRIVGKRTDGYHDLETVFYPVKLYDALEIIKTGQPDANTSLVCTGIPVGQPGEVNLCVKAYDLLKKAHSGIDGLEIHLHKAVPSGAGLGGGSADAAFMLKLLNRFFKLDLSTDELMAYALNLGSDCPFFIMNEPCFASGRGEILERIQLDLSAYRIVIVVPPIHISTKESFASVTPTRLTVSTREIVRQPVETWQHELVNDFEAPALQRYPEIKNVKDQLYAKGAIFAGMTGSGSGVFGLFNKSHQTLPDFPTQYIVKELPG